MSRLRISTQDKVGGALKLDLCLEVRLLAKFKGKTDPIKKLIAGQIEKRLTEVASGLQPLG